MADQRVAASDQLNGLASAMIYPVRTLGEEDHPYGTDAVKQFDLPKSKSKSSDIATRKPLVHDLMEALIMLNRLRHQLALELGRDHQLTKAVEDMWWQTKRLTETISKRRRKFSS